MMMDRPALARLFLFSVLLWPSLSRALNVSIDAGHGGMDTGATVGKVRESDVVLGVSKHLRDILNQDPQFHGSLTRDEDYAIDLKDRVKKARNQNSDLMISIHANSSPDPGSRGMEIYFRNELEPDLESLRLASQENQNGEVIPSPKNKKGDVQSILQDLKRSATSLKSYELSWHILQGWNVPFSKARHQAIKQGPFRVINHQDFPSVLVEIGFVTNAKEGQRLLASAYQKEIAQAIYSGLKDYKETLDSSQTKALSSINKSAK